MIPGVNPRQMKQMMRQMGMSQEDLDVTQVVMKLSNGKSLVFDEAQVQKIIMQGQATFQVSGSYEEVEDSFEVQISEDDVKTVMEQAGVSEDKARSALEKAQGDLAEAIVSLTE